MATTQKSVALIGAGISALCCARRLRDAGWSARLFEKSRGVGGRMSVRRGDHGTSFDHGAQYFTAKDARFIAEVDTWIASNVAARWTPRIGRLSPGKFEASENETARYVGVPAMTSIAKSLAIGLDIVSNTLIDLVEPVGHAWRLVDDQRSELGVFDWVVSSAPVVQTRNIFREIAEFTQPLDAVEMAPCWAAMVAFENPLNCAFDAAFVEDSPLAWIARNSSKPGRDSKPDCWVLHASSSWSKEHLEDAAEVALQQLIAAFWEALGLAPHEPLTTSIHRWRYAMASQALNPIFLCDAKRGLGVCGDGLGGPRVEGAFLSGVCMAEEMLRI
jgi:renalase